MTDTWWDTGRIAPNGYPEYYKTTELAVLLVIEVWIDDEWVVIRDAVQAFIWIEQFADEQRREDYLTYWLFKNLGQAVATPERLAKFRRKLMIVEPKDQHDYARCKRSYENALTFVRCEQGTVVRLPPILMGNWSDGLDALFNQRDELGACPCRCHDMQRQAMGSLPRMLRPEEYFWETVLGREEALRDA